MGSWATCYLGNFEVGSTKNDLDWSLIPLFRETDKIFVRESDGKEVSVEEFEEFIAIPSDEIDETADSLSLLYRVPIPILRKRLQINGYTRKNAEEIFRTMISYELAEANRRLTDLREAESQSRAILIPMYEDDVAVLNQLTPETWGKGLKIIHSENLTRRGNGLRGDKHPDPIVNYMLNHDWYGFPGPDLAVAICLALETLPAEEELIYDVTELAVQEYFSPRNGIVETGVGMFAEDHRSAAKILILTEGKTDVRILDSALKLLYPDVSDYYSFMDFDALRVGGGAGNLINIVKAFAAAGVANRTVALFDNDTAGVSAVQMLKAVGLPDHIKALTLPELGVLERYPTLGPSGPVIMNVNGMAASLELYLGSDVLSQHGELTPIQWTGYDSKLRRYQGEVLDKDLIHRRFSAKIQRAQNDSSELDESWNPLRAIFNSIFGIFEDFEHKRILDFVDGYYRQSK